MNVVEKNHRRLLSFVPFRIRQYSIQQQNFMKACINQMYQDRRLSLSNIARVRHQIQVKSTVQIYVQIQTWVYILVAPQFHPASICAKTQISCSTNESDDDVGYGSSLSSSDPALSASSSSIASESCEFTADQQHEDSPSKYDDH